MEEQELSATLTSLCATHGLKILIDPMEYAIRSPAAVDVEHDEEGNLVGIGVYDGTNSYYFTSVNTTLSTVLISCDALITHNGKGDFDSLRQWGVPLTDNQLVWDTFLIGHIIDSSLKAYGLKEMAKRELGITYPSYEDIVGKHKGKTKKAPKCPQTELGCCGRRTLDKWPVAITAAYNALDTLATFKLYLKQKDYINGFKR